MKTLIAAIATTIIAFSADAQIGKSANSKYAKNYSVCQTNGGYQVCGQRDAMNSVAGRSQTQTTVYGSVAMSETNIYMGERNTTRGVGRGRIRVSYPDDPNGAYEGKETTINDGVQKNKQRNLNQYNDAVVLPANDGGLSDRR